MEGPLQIYDTLLTTIRIEGASSPLKLEGGVSLQPTHVKGELRAFLGEYFDRLIIICQVFAT